MPSVFVAILNYGQPQMTIECLQSAVPEARRVGDCILGVCENGSGDDSEERIADAIAANGWSDVVELTAISPNRGFTGGNNAIIDPKMALDSPPDYVLLLNNDTLVREGAFAELIRFMEEHTQIGIAGSRLEDPEGTPQRSAFRFTGILSELASGASFGPVDRLLSRWLVAPPVVEHEIKTDWVAGASMIIRRAVIEAIGPLDEDYFTYFDDIDYCWNAAKAGWPTWYVPGSRVVHLVGATTSITSDSGKVKRRARYWFEARRRYYTKNCGALKARCIDLAFLLGMWMGNLIAAVRCKPRHLPERFIRDFWSQSTWVKGTKPPVVENPALNQA